MSVYLPLLPLSNQLDLDAFVEYEVNNTMRFLAERSLPASLFARTIFL